MCTFKKKTMATPRMNDASWVDGLPRARAAVKSAFVCIHVLAPLRDRQGVAPVVLQTRDGYLRAPAHMEAAFELCLRHLHRIYVPWPDQGYVTPQALLANRAVEALKLPGRFVPTAEGKVLVMEETGCHAESQAGMQEAAATTMGPSNGAEHLATQPEATTAAPECEDGQNEQTKIVESPIVDMPEGEAGQAAAEPSENVGQSESEVEQADALPPDASQPSGKAMQATAESPTADQPQGEAEHAIAGPPAETEGEAEQAGAEPSTTDPSEDGEVEQAAAEPSTDPSSTDPTIGEAVAKETHKPPLSTLSKKARRRAAQKARKRGR
jgi:hypothetical protein